MSDPTLARLLAEDEVRHLLATYARAVDRHDWDLLRTVFHPDARDDHGAYRGGIDGLVDYLDDAMSSVLSATHALAQVRCDHLDADTVDAETVATAVHRHVRRDGSLVDLTFAVRYLDRVVRRDGRWAISRRVVVVDRSRLDPVVAGDDLAAPFVRGAAGDADPSARTSPDDWPPARP